MSEQSRLAAIAIIKDEHRSLGAVIKGMEYLLAQGRGPGQRVNFQLLRASLYYIETFTEALHHPKEEGYLFRLLRNRTHDFDAQLAELEKQHVEEEGTYYELTRNLGRFQAHTPDAERAFAATLERFANEAWKHMRLEEEVILPAAAHCLTDEDWQEIAQAFSDNGDPRFGRAPDEHFRELFAQIQSLMP